jgi:hypothetical protein
MVSLDDLNDWAQRAAELEWFMEQIAHAMLNEEIESVGEFADAARPVAHFLKRSLIRAGAADPDAIEQRRQFPSTDYLFTIGPSPEAKRAAETLERAAMQVLALEKEMGVRGMGEVLADFAAELNMCAFREPHKEVEW